jgi:hypothetical protein
MISIRAWRCIPAAVPGFAGIGDSTSYCFRPQDIPGTAITSKRSIMLTPIGHGHLLDEIHFDLASRPQPVNCRTAAVSGTEA